jgi:hypothetical protein
MSEIERVTYVERGGGVEVPGGAGGEVGAVEEAPVVGLRLLAQVRRRVRAEPQVVDYMRVHDIVS